MESPGDVHAGRSNTASSTSGIGVHRFASLGLNRRPLSFTRQRKQVEEIVPRRTTYERNWTAEDKNDLDELEDLMVPQNMRPQRNDGGWQPMSRTKLSRFTTKLLTTSTWQLVGNAAYSTYGEQVERAEDEIDEQIEPEKYEQQDNENKTGSNRIRFEQTATGVVDVQDDDDDALWLADKYFDHNSFSEYLKTCTSPMRSNKQLKTAAKKRKRCSDVAKRAAVKSPHVLRRSPSSISQLRSISLSSGDADMTKMSKELVKVKRRTSKKLTNLRVTEDIPPHSSLSMFRRNSKTSDDMFAGHEELIYSSTPSPTPSSQPVKWELASGSTKPARIGVPEPDKLTFKLCLSQTQASKTPTYHDEDIDWHSNTAIHALNQWRTQTLRAHGITSKTLCIPYAPEQDAWLILLHRKIKTMAENGMKVKLPGAAAVTKAMNAFFADKVFTDESGRPLPQRELRDEMSVRGKLQKKNTRIWILRDVTRKLLEGKRKGKVYTPGIGDEELGRFLSDEAGDTVVNGRKMGALQRKCGFKVSAGVGMEVDKERMSNVIFIDENKENWGNYGTS